MEYEISLLLDLIKEKTGKDVVVYSDFDDKFFSTCGSLPDRAEYKVTDITPDEEKGKTYFRFRHRSESFIGYIDGSGEAEKGYCALIVALLENGVIKEAKEISPNALKSIILGEEKSANVKKYMNKFKVPETPCLAYAIFADDYKLSDVKTFSENFKSNDKDLVTEVEDGVCAYIKFVNSLTSENEESASDFARLLSASLFDEYGIKARIGVGSTVSGFSECAISYNQAVSAVKMGELFAANSPVFTYKEYVFIKMFEELPKYRLQEFLGVLLETDAKEIFDDEEMVETAEEFFNNNLNVSETSRKLFMHRNTLSYRLDKIEKSTGLDIRRFQDAVTFKLITILYRLMQRKGD